jgi:hypothetical protein
LLVWFVADVFFKLVFVDVLFVLTGFVILLKTGFVVVIFVVDGTGGVYL